MSSVETAMKFTFERIEPVSKKSRVVNLLRDAILSGAVGAGDQLVESRLAQQLGVGQALVREALIELEHAGLVLRTPFTGTMVPTLTLEDAEQIFEVRIELEPLAFELAATRADEAGIAAVSELVEQTRLAAKADDLEGFFDSHVSFRSKVWELSGNRYVQQALERVVIPLFGLYLSRSSGDRVGAPKILAMCLEHEDEILVAFRRRDGEAARRVARDFLVEAKNSLRTRLRSEMADEGGAPGVPTQMKSRPTNGGT
jgi:DNA-binding GntR family transcriptional regulator